MGVAPLADECPPGLAGDLARLEAKVDRLLASGSLPDVDRAATFWALQGLRARAEDPAGEVLLTGDATLSTGDTYAWQQGAGVGPLLELDWADRADVLGAIAHPVRLQLLQQIALGVRTTAALAASEGLGTTGQLHHHLRQLVTTGWLRKAGRGAYELPPARAIPLLIILVAAER